MGNLFGVSKTLGDLGNDMARAQNEVRQEAVERQRKLADIEHARAQTALTQAQTRNLEGTVIVPFPGPNGTTIPMPVPKSLAPKFLAPALNYDARLRGQDLKTESTLLQLGMRRNPQTGELEQIPENELPPTIASKLERNKVLNELAEAQTALNNAKNDPNSPFFQLAQERLRIAWEAARRVGMGVFNPVTNERGEITGFYNNKNPQLMVTPGAPGMRRSGLPTEALATETGMDVLLDQFNKLKSLAGTRPDAIGPVAGRYGKNIEAQYLGDDPQAADLYQTVDDISNQLVYLLSGKQINQQEYIRLRDTLPDYRLPVPTFKVRLTNFEHRLQEVLNRRRASPALPLHGSESGQPPAPPTQGPKLVFNVTKWKKANPTGDVEAAKALARSRGMDVIE